MADYYPLISRALDGLSDKSPDMRRAVYERARTALMAQLQSLNPPLPVSEITRERLRRGVFRSVTELEIAIHRYLADHDERAKPFVWTADPAAILEKVRRAKQALESQH